MDISCTIEGVSIRKDTLQEILLSCDINDLLILARNEDIEDILDETFWKNKSALDLSCSVDFSSLGYTEKEIYTAVSPTCIFGSEEYVNIYTCLRQAIEQDNETLTMYYLQKGASIQDMLVFTAKTGYTPIAERIATTHLLNPEIWLAAGKKAARYGHLDILKLCLKNIDPNLDLTDVLNMVSNPVGITLLLPRCSGDMDEAMCTCLRRGNIATVEEILTQRNIHSYRKIGMAAGESLQEDVIKFVQQKGADIADIVAGIASQGDVELIYMLLDEISPDREEYLSQIYFNIVSAGYSHIQIVKEFLPRCSKVPDILSKVISNSEVFPEVYSRASNAERVAAKLKAVQNNIVFPTDSPLDIPLDIPLGYLLLHALLSRNKSNILQYISAETSKQIPKNIAKDILFESTYDTEIFDTVHKILPWKQHHLQEAAYYCIKHDNFLTLSRLLDLGIDTSEMGPLIGSFGSRKCLDLLLRKKKLRDMAGIYEKALYRGHYGCAKAVSRYLKAFEKIDILQRLLDKDRAFNIVSLFLGVEEIDISQLNSPQLRSDVKILLQLYSKYRNLLQCYNFE